MDEPRVDIYNFPHKGLRNLMSQLSLIAGNTDYSNQNTLDKLKGKTAELVLLLNLHRQSEEDDLLPALEKKLAGSTQENVKEHELLEQQVGQIDTFIKNLTTASSPAKGIQFYAMFNGFQSKYMDHMAMEESTMNPLIWDHFTDEELMGIHGSIMAKLAPEHITQSFKYIVPALNPMERTVILSGFKANAPEEFFDQVLEVIRGEMPSTSFEEMVASL